MNILYSYIALVALEHDALVVHGAAHAADHFHLLEAFLDGRAGVRLHEQRRALEPPPVEVVERAQRLTGGRCLHVRRAVRLGLRVQTLV